VIPLIQYPEIVQRYAPYFAKVFSAQALLQFERYISGLIVSENKTVEGINRLFVFESRNQSSLNRMLTESPFSLSELNQARLDLLNSFPGTQVKAKGVLSVDDTLLTHFGKQFEQIAQLYDHTQSSYVWAHCLVTLHYSDDLTDYPAFFQLWKPVDLDKLEQGLLQTGIKLRESKLTLKTSDLQKWRLYVIGVWRRNLKKYPQIAELYDSKLQIAKQLLEQWVKAHSQAKLPVTFDTWYTQPDFCQFISETLHLNYVGSLGETEQVALKTGLKTLGEFAEQLKAEHLEALKANKPPVFKPVTIDYKGEQERYYSYCNTHRIHNYGKLRLVINYRQADLSDNPVFYVSNQLRWQAFGITRIRRHRWPVEVYHEEGKAEGLDQYQVRDLEAIERHIALVAVVYSLLRTAQHDPDLQTRLQRELQFELEGSAPFWRRATQAHSLWVLALFVSAGLAQGQTLSAIMEPLLRAVCPLS
jgi:hypothetical protein